MLCEWRPRRQLVVWRVAFPLDRRVRVLEQRFEEIFEKALAIRAVRHDQKAGLRVIETHHVVPPTFVVPFLEKRLAIRSPVEAPSEAVAQADAFVLIGGFSVQAGELVLREDLNLWAEHLLTRLLAYALS